MCFCFSCVFSVQYVGVARTFISYQASERQRNGVRTVWGTAVLTNMRICVSKRILTSTSITAQNSAYCRTRLCCGYFPAHVMSDFGKTNEMCYVIMPAECMCASLGRRKPPQPTFNSGTSHVEINYYRVSLEISPLQNVFAFVPG